MSDEHIYIEENRFCQESQCKRLKRFLVGFIRFIESSNQDANIPEHFFDDVPDNVGFDYEYAVDENDNDIRCFKLTNEWQFGKDDCGGSEHGHPDEILYSLDNAGNIVFKNGGNKRKTHLRLVTE